MKAYISEGRESVGQKAFSNGLLLLGYGCSAICFYSSLILSKEYADIALSVFEECLKETM